MVAFGDINTWNPGPGHLTTWAASPASRAALRTAPVDPLPPTDQRTQHLRSAYRAAQLGVTLPRLLVGAWDVGGRCDMTAMTEAINAHVRGQDTYHSAFEVDGDAIVRRTVADPTAIELLPTAVGFLDAAQIRQHALTSTPGTLDWDCFTFGVVQGADHFTFYASIDHLHFDGMSMGPLFLDINHRYRAAVDRRPDPLPPSGGYRAYATRQHGQADELTVDSPVVRKWIDAQGDGIWPSFPLPTGTPGMGAGTFITAPLLDAAQTDAFGSACRTAGARFSGGVMACAALADHHFTGNTTFRGLTPSDTRDTESEGLSVGWFASLFPVRVPIGDGSFTDAARAAQESFDTNKHLAETPFSRVFELAGAAGLDVAMPTSPPMMVSYMDLRAMTAADLWAGTEIGLFGDELSHGGINVWVNRHTDGTTVTISLPDNEQARKSVHRYIAVLQAVFAAAAGLGTGFIDDVARYANTASSLAEVLNG